MGEGRYCPTMDLLHSEQMQLVQFIIPIESAHRTISYLGDLGLFQFKAGDVIVSFDGVHVGCEGTLPFRSTERIAFRYLVSQKFTGDIVKIGIIRAGAFTKVQAGVIPRVHLVPYHIKGGQPSYLVVCEEHEDNIGLKLTAKARYSFAKFVGEQIVILSHVLANEVNIGYEDVCNEQVLRFSGVRIINIHHLAHLIDYQKMWGDGTQAKVFQGINDEGRFLTLNNIMSTGRDINIDDLEVKLGELEAELIEMNANSEKLQRAHSELLEYKLVLQKTGEYFSSAQSSATDQQREFKEHRLGEGYIDSPLLFGMTY